MSTGTDHDKAAVVGTETEDAVRLAHEDGFARGVAFSMRHHFFYDPGLGRPMREFKTGAYQAFVDRLLSRPTSAPTSPEKPATSDC